MHKRNATEHVAVDAREGVVAAGIVPEGVSLGAGSGMASHGVNLVDADVDVAHRRAGEPGAEEGEDNPSRIIKNGLLRAGGHFFISKHSRPGIYLKHFRDTSMAKTRLVAALALLMLLPAAPTIGQNLKTENSARPRLFTNEALIKSWQNNAPFDISNVRSVFQFVLESLPEKVRVYPTENYYYFYFFYKGIKYAGNIRINPETADNSQLHFVYYKDATPWVVLQNDTDHYALLGKKSGVVVHKVAPLTYQVTSRGKSVRFALNNLAGKKPPPGTLRNGERYLGPVFDESGLQFFLVFDRGQKQFRYLLDETSPVPDHFSPLKTSGKLSIGWRTGFVFFQEDTPKRKILVAVHGPSTRLNTYLDGPFDQLPDNFLKGDELRQAILQVRPNLKGKIDRFGRFATGQERYLIAPYRTYAGSQDLEELAKCAALKDLAKLYACFANDDE